MEKIKRKVAAFDFDGTLTHHDSLPRFIRFVRGPRAYYQGLLALSPMLVAYKLGWISNSRAKERLFSHFFRGIPEFAFRELGRQFASEIEKDVRADVVAALRQRKVEGCRVYVVSASIEDWVAPWCLAAGADEVLATQVEIGVDKRLTGRFSTPNCYGTEKVRCILEREPERDSYKLYAYGDSRGDKELLAFADYPNYVGRG